jgi:3-oxoacyl-[acyl-carrier protein] reductase
VGRLDGKVAIVTGAGRGIGRATALRLAADGAAVVVNDIDGEPAHETADLVKQAGGVASVSLADTVDLAAARELADSTVEQHGKLDILVNNAGITRDRMFHNLDDDLFDFVLDVNLKTAVHATQAAMPHMREVAKAEIKANGKVAYQRKIVNTSSSVAFTGNPGQANYTAAKGAIISLTRTLARELGPFGITVNAVAPGFIETRLTAAKGAGDDLGVPEATRQMAVAITALGRPGRPEDVAAVHAFLAGPDSDFVTGVTIPVTGGQLGVM